MIYDFSDLTVEQKERLEKEVNHVLLDLTDEDWVNLYNCIFADKDKFPPIYENNDCRINQVLKDKNIWGILQGLEKNPYYSVEDGWFTLRNNTLYSNDDPQRLLWDKQEAIDGMAKLLVENYADDFDISELYDVMRPYSADYDEDEE